MTEPQEHPGKRPRVQPISMARMRPSILTLHAKAAEIYATRRKEAVNTAGWVGGEHKLLFCSGLKQ